MARLNLATKGKHIAGELALIVGGVLIALAVDSWWEMRQERQRETAYLQQLLSDARETENRLTQSITGDSAILARVDQAIAQAFSGRVPPADSFNLPTGYQQFRPLTGTLTALIQNGDLRLLRNDSIRFRVISYVALIDATDVMLRHTESVVWNSTEYVLRGIMRHSRANPSGWGPVNRKAALDDPDVVAALQAQASASRNRLRNLARLQEPTADLIRLLKAELNQD